MIDKAIESLEDLIKDREELMNITKRAILNSVHNSSSSYILDLSNTLNNFYSEKVGVLMSLQILKRIKEEL